MTRSAWPPAPPDPPFPPRIPEHPPTPWQPAPRPPVPPSTAMSVVVEAGNPLAERLLERRILALAGDLDADAVNRAVAGLALLDAGGDEPVQLRLSGVRADLDAALPLVDAIDLVGAPVHGTALGTLTGAAVALLAVCDRRAAGAHAVFQLTEPRAPRVRIGDDVEALAAAHAGQLRRLQERLAEATGRDVEQVAADMRDGRVLSADEAREYGLVDR